MSKRYLFGLICDNRKAKASGMDFGNRTNPHHFFYAISTLTTSNYAGVTMRYPFITPDGSTASPVIACTLTLISFEASNSAR